MRRSTALVVVVLLAWLGFSGPAGAATAQQVDRVVVIGVPGLRWDDVSEARTPALARMQRDGASGLLSVKTAAPRDCAAAGWLTLGAGNRVDPAGDEPARCSTALPDASSLPAEVTANAERREGAVPGLLARALRRGGSCVDALGPGAELGAADLSGAVGVSGAAEPCPVLLRSADLTTVDAIVGAELDRRKPGHVVLVVGLSELGSQTPHLHVALALGPGFAQGELVSASTRRPGHVQLVDVAPTLLALQGLAAPPEMIGEPWRSSGERPTLAALRDGDRQAVAQRTVTVPFFVILCAVQLVLLVPALWRRWWRTTQVVALSGVTALGASYLANLVPWWRADSPLLAVIGLTTAGAWVLTALAMLGRGVLSRAGLACGMVAAIVTVDLLTGASLQLSSVAGYSPLVAGRFAGIGNVAFGVLAAAVLLAAAATRRPALAALTALVVVVDGAPQWGSDVGGVLALVPAYAVLVLLLSGRTASLGRLAVAGVTGALVVTAFGVADYLRAAQDRTHLGRFVGQVLDGTAVDVLQRKAAANAALLFHSPVTALLPVVVLVLVFVVRRPPARLREVFEKAPAWRAGLLAVATASALGFALNDSGSAVVGLAILVALPATIAVVARRAQLGDAAG